jgi:hypothetical protein
VRKFGSILEIVGIFSIIMTGVRLYNAGFPRLEGPEGETAAGVLRILAPYAVMLLISLGVAGLGGTLANRPLSAEEKMEKDERVVTFYRTTLSAWSSGKLADLHSSFKMSGKMMRAADLMSKYQPYNDIAIRTMFEKFSPAPCEFMVGSGNNWFILTNLRLIQKDGKTDGFREVALADIDSYELREGQTDSLVCRMKAGTEILFENVLVYPKPEFLNKMLAHPIPA